MAHTFLEIAPSPEGPGRPGPVRAELVVLVAIALLSIVRISSTFRVFVQTSDEPAHIATGMEWLDRGTYNLEHLHPPLARVMTAVGPYLLGRRSEDDRGLAARGNRILYGSSDYFGVLAAARWGVVPFFLVALVTVWLWSRRLFGPWAALFSALIFSMLPEPLAHGGLATTDMAGAATVLAAYATIAAWTHRPSWYRALGVGFTMGLALLSKFSSVLFLPLGAIIIVAVLARKGRLRLSRGRITAQILLVLLLALFVVWAGYRFSFGTVASVSKRVREEAARVEPDTAVRRVLRVAASEVPVPAPEFLSGIEAVRQYNRSGQLAYLFGEVRQDGWWYYYPVALLVKTPIAFLLLTIFATLSLRRFPLREGKLLPILLALGILTVACTAHLDLGIRYVLIVYPLLSIPAGAAVMLLWRRRWGRVMGAGLMGWLILASALAHPDYLAYFNVAARPWDDRILLDSNLDWGQDLDRLEHVLEQKRASSVALSYFGTARPEAHLRIPIRPLFPDVVTPGWIAISEMNLKGVGFGRGPVEGGTSMEGFQWLDSYGRPEMVGHSIRLYHVVP